MSFSGYRSMPALASMVAILLVASSAACGRTNDTPLPLTTVADVPLTGGTTRWDYASFDPGQHHLFLAHLGDSVVTVFDTEGRRVVADIPDVSHVHGVLAVPALGRIYASATGTDEVVAIDAKTFKILARTPAGDYPDGMAYAPDAHKLYVSDEHGGSDTVIDVRTHQRVATIPLGGEVGNTQYDPASKHIFANVQTRRQLVEIDPSTDKVIARIDLPGAKGNHGLYIDAPARLAFIACEDNAKLLVLDLGTRRVIASYEVGEDPDVLAFDPALGWLYVASESGKVALFELKGRALHPLGLAMLAPDAHVVAVDAATHRAYFPLKDWKGHPVLRITAPRPAAQLH
ncbi:MAG TPA: YncE family protein [Frateuria sp.]|uniref:YncE family protein n=1 Tax=Frateuria sp. TaxID=2211372 RepID=UPI002DE492D3|nr:YncE family protein [Frateuria sp.]